MKTDSRKTRVLVIRAGQLGDTVCASSIIEPLRNHFGPNVVIDWLAKSGIGQIFTEDPRINRIFELRNRRPPIIFNPAKFAVVSSSWRQPYDYVVNLELGSIFNDVVRLLRAGTKIGMPYRHFTEPPEFHAVENLKLIYQSFLDSSDLEKAEPSLKGTSVERIREKFDLTGDYYVLVPANSHYGKSGKPNYRAWPESHWRELMAGLAERNLQAVVIGGKGEEAFFATLSPFPRGVRSLVGKTRFPELVGLIEGAHGVIATDTGPSHIAAAVNTPVYALIGPTNFRRTGPYLTRTNEVHIISANLPCSPCYHTERLAQCKKNECMYTITPAEVLAKISQST